MGKCRAMRVSAALVLTVIMVLCCGKYAVQTAKAAGDVAINTTNFPDAVFRKYVSDNFDTDGNGKLSAKEIAEVDLIDVDSTGVANMKGLEYFTAVEYVFCGWNDLKTLDISKNTNLINFSCYGNQMTKLVVGNLSNLDALDCGDNKLTSIDVTGCPALTYLYCAMNQLSTVNVTKNTELNDLRCFENKLTTLDLSHNRKLTLVYCSDNELTSLDVSNNPLLEEYDIDEDVELRYVAVTKQPVNATVAAGTTAKFTVAARGQTELTYQWQAYNTNTKKWVNSSAAGAKTATLSIKATSAIDGFKFRCIVKDVYGRSATSQVATLSLPTPLSITAQPKGTTVTVGATAKFTVTATGTGALTYQWQAYNPGTKKWVNSSAASAKTASLSIKAQASHNGFKFRCVVTDSKGNKTTSNAAALTVKPGITTQPKALTVPVGGKAEFTIAASGAGTLKYQWQAYSPSTKKWVNSSSASATTAKLSITAQAAHHNFKFRCIVTDGNGNSTTSNAVLLTVRPGIVTQPKDVTVAVGKTVKLTVSAKSVGTLSYQWQVWDTSSKTWKNSSAASAKTANFSFKAQAGHNGKKFRCVLTDSNGNQTVTRGALVTVK